MSFSRDALRINAAEESHRIAAVLAQNIRTKMRRNGAVVGISGGVDSSVVLALCARALGPQRVRAVVMPEHDSDPESESLARQVAAALGVDPILEPISSSLEAFGCYRRKNEAIRRLFPDYDPARGYKSKITLPPNLLETGTLNVFSITIISPDGQSVTKPLPPGEYRQIVAASNFKQRTRMSMLYYYAEINNYAVVGTANKNEHDLGFFVKYGDGGVDIQPIAHLYKTQVYQLAESLGIPEPVRKRVPTTDTYSAPASQQDFFFRLSFDTMDLLWFAMEKEVPLSEVSRVMSLSEEQILRAYGDFVRKRRATEYIRLHPVAIDPGECHDGHLIQNSIPAYSK